MKILVCICKVPDTTSKIRFTDNNTKFDEANVQFIINPLDEFALTRALEIKEELGGTVTVINVGLSDTEPLIRKALAIGADDSIRVDLDPTCSYLVAEQIAHYAKDGNYDLIMAGRETIDFNGSQVGGLISEMLGLPFVSGASRLDINNDTAILDREIEGGKETLELKLPFVASIHEGIAEPRIPTMRGIMSARSKPLKVEPAISNDTLVNIESYEQPEERGQCKYIDKDTPEQLVDLLNREAKVI